MYVFYEGQVQHHPNSLYSYTAQDLCSYFHDTNLYIIMNTMHVIECYQVFT